MTDPDSLITALWGAWMIAWLLAAVWSGRTVARQSVGSKLLQSVFFWVGATLLFFTRWHGGALAARVVPRAEWIRWIGAVATLFGLLHTGWARIHLGRLWSATVTLKENHTVVQSGPYAWTRHPIYTGLLAAIVGTALAHGTLAALAGAALFAVGIVLKLRGEERLLTEHLGEAYRDYMAAVPALVPRFR